MKSTEKLLALSLTILFLVSITMANVSFASPATYLYIDPPLIQGTPEGKVQIAINVYDAPPTYSWELHLSWDAEHLEVTKITEGDFLHRWKENPFPPPPDIPKYLTNYGKTPFDEANLAGEMWIECTLVGPLPMNDWASGNGGLVSLEFLAQAPGSVRLDLFGARLWDHMAGQYPAPTDYPSEGCHIDATGFFFAGLVGWEFKLNGRAGDGSKGIQTTVGTANLLEAYVSNQGIFAAYVQAFFEIRDSLGYWIATVPSNTVLLQSGGNATLSATWTTKSPTVYYITAYSRYGNTAPPKIPDGFSRTLRLKVV